MSELKLNLGTEIFASMKPWLFYSVYIEATKDIFITGDHCIIEHCCISNIIYRFAFDFIYFTLLVIAILLSSTYILIGLFILGDMHCYYNSFFDEFYPPARIAKYIMGGWLFCTSVIFFLFDIYHITDERTEKDKQIYQMAAMQDNKLLPDGSLASSTYPHSEGFYTPTDMPLRHSVFALFVIVCVIFTVALVTTIGLS